MNRSTFSLRAAAAALAVTALSGSAARAADVTDIGVVDQAQLSALPAFQAANRAINDYGSSLQKDYVGRARSASQAEQQRLATEFQSKMAEKQRAVLGPLFGKAQVAIASVASSKNLSVVVDKRIIVYGGVDITGNVRDLLTGPGDPVPPVNTPPPSSVGWVDHTQIDAIPAIKNATDEFAKFKADQDRAVADKLKSAKNDTERNAVLKDYQKVLEDKQKQTLQPFVDKTRNAMSEVARARGLTLVIDRTNVIYGGVDITADVTSKLK